VGVDLVDAEAGPSEAEDVLFGHAVIAVPVHRALEVVLEVAVIDRSR
jgi:hypothetical protein